MTLISNPKPSPAGEGWVDCMDAGGRAPTVGALGDAEQLSKGELKPILALTSQFGTWPSTLTQKNSVLSVFSVVNNPLTLPRIIILNSCSSRHSLTKT